MQTFQPGLENLMGSVNHEGGLMIFGKTGYNDEALYNAAAQGADVMKMLGYKNLNLQNLQGSVNHEGGLMIFGKTGKNDEGLYNAAA